MQYTCGAPATVVLDLPIHPKCSLLAAWDAVLRRRSAPAVWRCGLISGAARLCTLPIPPGIPVNEEMSFMRKVLLASVASMGALLAAGGANAQPVQPVAPATIVVHMNGYFQFGLDDVGSTYNNVGGSKLNPVTTNGEFRLYPGFDAMTVNGIEYGAKIETRVTFSNGSK